MAILGDILATWTRPRAIIRAKLAAGLREDRALAIIMGAGALAFVAQTPKLARAAHLDPSIPLDARMGGALVACLFFLPLLAYLFAFFGHIAQSVLGGRGTSYGARLALFWAFLAVTPMMLAQGLVAGFIGAGAALTSVQLLVMLGFLWMYLAMMHEVAQGDDAD